MNGDFLEHYFTNNEALKSELRTIHYKYHSDFFVFYSDNGVFSKDKIDFGSKFLVETILAYEKIESAKNKNLLDVGCGYGFIGIVLAKILGIPATLIDVNKRAIHLTKMNKKENEVHVDCFLSDVYEGVEDKYDFIVTNPPIRAGKQVVLKILLDARKYLKEQGVFWFVIRKDQGAKSTISLMKNEYETEVVKKEKGFFVVRAKKKLT